MKGKFIVVEGIDGSGKSTICKFLVKILKIYGFKKIKLVRDPGGNLFSENIRNLILNNNFNSNFIVKESILLMLYASRIQLLKKVILPNINLGYNVISDRYNFSSLAYQGYGWNISKSLIRFLDKIFINFFLPDLVIYLDISPFSSLMRIYNSRKLDFIERESIRFFYRVYSFYKNYFRIYKGNKIIINANLSLKNIFIFLKRKIYLWLNQKNF